MSRGSSAERERFWRELLDRQRTSGLSVRRFCSIEGVSEPSFYLWRKRLGPAKQTAASEPAGGPRPERPSQPALFVPLGLFGSADSDAGGNGGEAALEIIHPHGCRVRVIGEVNVVSLGRVLETLDERGAR